MFKMNAYELNGVEYIVVNANDSFMNEAAIAVLASRKYGVGADRILVVDEEASKLVKVVDGRSSVQLASVDDYSVFQSFVNGSCEAGVYASELRLTDYFLQQLITAGSVGHSSDKASRKAAC